LFGYSAVLFQRPSRFIATVLSVVTVADTLHDVYAMLKASRAKASQDD
jgi:hypothetical protein